MIFRKFSNLLNFTLRGKGVEQQNKSGAESFLFFVVPITINNVDVTGLLVAALG